MTQIANVQGEGNTARATVGFTPIDKQLALRPISAGHLNKVISAVNENSKTAVGMRQIVRRAIGGTGVPTLYRCKTTALNTPVTTTVDVEELTIAGGSTGSTLTFNKLTNTTIRVGDICMAAKLVDGTEIVLAVAPIITATSFDGTTGAWNREAAETGYELPVIHNVKLTAGKLEQESVTISFDNSGLLQKTIATGISTVFDAVTCP